MLLIDHAPIADSTGHAAGRTLLAKLYRQHTGKSLPKIALQSGGKPYFPEVSLHFSITHTPRHVFCALSDRPVGIDAEELSRPVNLHLADKLLSPGEKLQYDAADNKEETLLRFWVLKEAQGKLTGEGVRPWPNHTEFRADDPRITVTEDCLLAVFTE